MVERNPNQMSDVSRRIYTAMLSKNLSQKRLALESGLSANAVRDLFDFPDRSPRLSTLQAIAKRLGVSVASLIGEEILAPAVKSDFDQTYDRIVKLLEILTDLKDGDEPILDLGKDEIPGVALIMARTVTRDPDDMELAGQKLRMATENVIDLRQVKRRSL